MNDDFQTVVATLRLPVCLWAGIGVCPYGAVWNCAEITFYLSRNPSNLQDDIEAVILINGRGKSLP